jgi:hypothetical protein
MSTFQFRISTVPVPSPPIASQGSFKHDRDSGRYRLSWESWDEFEAWRKAEEEAKAIKLWWKEIHHPKKGTVWTEKHIYVCTRQGTGEKVNYERKNPDWQRNVESKRTGCSCWLTIKSYPNMAKLCGMYFEDHSHEIGRNNIQFQRLSPEVCNLIRNLLKVGVELQRIVSYCLFYEDSHQEHEIRLMTCVHNMLVNRDRLISLLCMMCFGFRYVQS